MTARPVGPICEGVTQVELDGEICVFSPSTGQVLFLNATAAEVWQLVDGTRGLQQIVAALAAHYGLSPEEVTEDVVAVLHTFQDQGLLAAPDTCR